MLVVELFVVLVAEVRTEQRQVGLADYYAARFPRQACYRLVFVKHPRVLQSLVVSLEACNPHAVQPVEVLDYYVEVAHEEIVEVVACHLEEQFVLIDGVRVVCQQEQVRRQPVGNELPCLYRVAVVQHRAAPLPHVAYVEFSSAQPPAGVHPVYYHACNLADAAVRVVLHHVVHVLQASVGIAVVQFPEPVDEYELVAVCAHRETFLRHLRVPPHLSVPVGLECRVCGGI